MLLHFCQIIVAWLVNSGVGAVILTVIVLVLVLFAIIQFHLFASIWVLIGTYASYVIAESGTRWLVELVAKILIHAIIGSLQICIVALGILKARDGDGAFFAHGDS